VLTPISDWSQADHQQMPVDVEGGLNLRVAHELLDRLGVRDRPRKASGASGNVSLLLDGAAFALGLYALPAPSSAPAPTVEPSWWDLPGRALAAMALVLVLTGVSASLGPHLSGLLAPFPIITGVLAVFSHGEFGAARTVVLLRNFLLGFYGFAAFCFVLAIGLPSLTTGAAFGLATAAALAAQAALFLLRSLRTGSARDLQESE